MGAPILAFAAAGALLALRFGKCGKTKLDLQDTARYWHTFETRHGYLIDRVEVTRYDRFAQMVTNRLDTNWPFIRASLEKTDHWSLKPFDVEHVHHPDVEQLGQMVNKVIDQNPDLNHQEMLEKIVQQISKS